MHKLRLDVEDLVVESFNVQTEKRKEKGTVFARQTDYPEGCVHYTHDPGMAECYSYAQQCEATAVPTNCPYSDFTSYCVCRDSITACG